MVATAYERSQEIELIELGEDDEREKVAHQLMAQTGHILPDGRFLVWQEIEGLTDRTIEVKRAYVLIPVEYRALFTRMRPCQLSAALT